MTTPARNNLWLSKSALDSATPKKLYPLGVSFWPYQMRFERIGSYDVTALLRNCYPKYLPGLPIHEGKAQRVSALFESAQHTGALARGVGVGTWVAIDERAGEGAVDEDGELAGGGGEGLLRNCTL